jgi:orotate phosphoribosyltransferase
VVVDGRDSALADLGREIVAVAYLEGDFVLSSGRRSRYYLDKYLFETRPTLLRGIARALAARLPPDVDRIAGPELGAVALAAALSLETNLPFVISRRESKDYSTSKSIEGELQPGERVVVVEDVITTGAQAIKAAERLRAAGAEVVGILGVIDREEGGREAIEAAGFSFSAVFTRTSLGI